jgi:hypothetical protein
MPEVIVCTVNTQLPKTPLWCYVSPTLDGALAMHAGHKRAIPRQVYQLRREFYFPVEAANPRQGAEAA